MLRALFALCLLCCLLLSEGRPQTHFSKHGKERRAIKGVDNVAVDLVDRIVNGAAADKKSHPYLVSILLARDGGGGDYEFPEEYYDYEFNGTEDGEWDGDGWGEGDGGEGDWGEGDWGEGDWGEGDWGEGDYDYDWKRSRLAVRVPRPWQLGSHKPGNGNGHSQQHGNRPHPGNGHRPWWMTQPAVEAGNDTENENSTNNEVRPIVEQGKPGHGSRPGYGPRPSFMQARGNARRWKHHHARGHVKASNATRYHICGGTLIHPQWVLTAAHCVQGVSNISSLSVKIGEYNMSNNLEPNEEVKPVKTIIPHPNYDGNTVANDIALLKLETAVDITKVEINTIPLPATALPAKATATITGWGLLKEGDADLPAILQEANVTVLSQDACKSAYGSESILDTMVCAHDAENLRDSCNGDSGGPLISMEGSKKVVSGIVSWGNGCAKKEYPGVYTRVYSYIDWIKQTMQANP